MQDRNENLGDIQLSSLSYETKALEFVSELFDIYSWEWRQGEEEIHPPSELIERIGLNEKNSSFHDLISVIDPEHASEFANAIQEAKKGILFRTEELRITVPGKTPLYFKVGIKPIPSRKEYNLIFLFQDITRVRSAQEMGKKIENSLSQSERTFIGAFENSGIGMALVSDKGKWLKVNRKLCEMLGYTEEELFTKTFQDITHPDDLSKDLNRVQAMLEGDIDSYKIEKRYFHKNGETIWINLSVSIVRDQFGKFLYFVSQIEDITEKKKAEESLLAINYEMRQILDSATHVSIIRTDPNGMIQLFSRGAENLFGYKAEEIVGQYTTEYLHDLEDTLKRSKELSNSLGTEIRGFDTYSEIAKRSTYDSRVWRYKRKDGSLFPMHLVLTAVRGQNSEITGFLGIGTDVSGSVEYQERLEETKRQLEALTEQLSRKNAQLLNYAHITSHNLRAPTSNLISLVELIEESKSQEDILSLVGKFKVSVNYLQETLNSLVEVLRIQEGNNRKIETVKFRSVLDKILKILEGQILETHAEVRFDFSALEEWQYDKVYMESILLNLLSNSIKYRSPDRTPKIYIQSQISEGQAYLIVEDNGLGIDLKKYQSKLFGLHKTFHRHPDAKGVGLFLTKSQIEALDGRISVESELNKGTKMIIELYKPKVFSSNGID
ncbi:PAS domain S-box protein [Leptospira langatensis]|uniref:histidine kinase n=1 Tax=Leptospira langatensis TaxID=2484983 RepID=A0A5F1ZWS4_9LEPT|nr:HAMP domain-containing sensor histidine kinase [Leptospira langatensis]TGJ98477.1 PAS domain S-box protein [Leptospira langatensis]TGL43391.1 PAS domain S-box protein [Leptospira langatensis]